MKMKKKGIYYILSAIFLFTLSCSESEKEDWPSSGEDYTLTTQSEVDAFNITSNINNLTITGEEINNLSNLKFQKVENLSIENTSIVSLSLPALNAIHGSLIIKNNDHLTDLEGLNNLKFVNGIISIEDNNSLVDISGFLGIKWFEGNLTIIGNRALGKNERCNNNEIGFCVVKHLVESGILSGDVILANNHPDAPTTVEMIGKIPGGDIISYTILSKDDAQNFAPLSDTIMDMHISGLEIADLDLQSIASKIVWAKGTVTLENTSVTTTEGFFDVVHCDGSIKLINNQLLDNSRGFKDYTKINGDLIIENCPNMTYWNSSDGQTGVTFYNVERIEGNFRIDPASKLDESGSAFARLLYVGGNFELIGDPTYGEIWNISAMHIKHIGGDLVYKNHYKVNGLNGFQELEYIGGDVYILDNGGPDGVIPILSTSAYQIGFCLIRELYDKGVMKKENVKIELRAQSTDPYINFNELTHCN
jgi:hypothetical protein